MTTISSAGSFTPAFGPADGGIIPLGDLAQKNPGQRLWRKLQFRRYAGDIVAGHGGSQHRREVQDLEAGLLQLVVGHRSVGSAKIDGLVHELADSAARTDGLIIDLHVGMKLVVLVKPFGINGIGECCPCRIDILRAQWHCG